MNKTLTKSKFPLIGRTAPCVTVYAPKWLEKLKEVTVFYFYFLPFPTDLTNLIIIRNSSSVDAQGSPSLERNKFTQIQFRMIKYKDLKLVCMYITSKQASYITLTWQRKLFSHFFFTKMLSPQFVFHIITTVADAHAPDITIIKSLLIYYCKCYY